MANIVGKIEQFLNIQDVPNNYIVLDGRTVSKERYPRLWAKIQFSPKLYKGFSITDTGIQVPDYTGYYLKQDKDYLGRKRTDTMRPQKQQEIPSGSFPMLINRDQGIPTNSIRGPFSLGAEIMYAFSVWNGGNIVPPDKGINIAPSTVIFGLYEIKFRGTDFYNNTLEENHIGDVIEPQNVSIVFAICGSTTIIHYGLLYPDGMGKKYPDNTITQVQDNKKFVSPAQII